MNGKLTYKPQAVFTTLQKRYIKVKRVMDFLLALLMLAISWPFLLLAMLWVKLESKGPVIFKQRRPGYHQKIFSIYKLRTMRIEVTDKTGRPLTDDERMTKSGNFLRKTSIDELPQLINVLKGDRGIIGTTKKTLIFQGFVQA